jgi:hypothetical protein
MYIKLTPLGTKIRSTVKEGEETEKNNSIRIQNSFSLNSVSRN